MMLNISNSGSALMPHGSVNALAPRRDKGPVLRRGRPMSLEPDALDAHPDVVEQLRWPFDFDAERQPRDAAGFTIAGSIEFRLIGRDGTGGQFAQFADQRILYASSEGQAGIIAANFEEFIKLIVAHPYWRDILHYSAGGKLDEMRRAAIALEARALDEEEDLVEARELVKSELGLDEPDDPVGALHHAVSASDVTIGYHYDNTCVPCSTATPSMTIRYFAA
jgi:hypothetical protein